MNTRHYIIGINGGGTRTSMVLVDERVTVLARAEVGASNANYIGVEAAVASLRAGINQVLQGAGLTRDVITGIGAGLAGVDRPADHALFAGIFAELMPGVPLVLDNDAIPALVAGAGRRFGIVTISGTGMIALGINAQGQLARAGGWGHFVDQGSGYAVARDALHAVMAAHDGRGPQTALTALVLDRLGLQTPTELVSWLYTAERQVSQVAALAEHAITAAAQGDGVALRILARTAQALADVTIHVAEQLGLASEPFPLVMSGSLFTYSDLLRDLFSLFVESRIPTANPMIATRDAAIGAAIMALTASGVALPAEDMANRSKPEMRRAQRATERRNPLTTEAHRLSTLDFLTRINIEDERVAGVVAKQIPQIAALIDAAAERFRQGGRILLIGAGTSGRLAVLDAAECTPTFGTTPEQISGMIAGGPAAMFTSIEGAEDDEAAGRDAVAGRQIGPRDTVIGVAASGSTPFVLGAMREARSRSALTGSITNVVNAPITALTEHPIVAATGAEILTGSTRLKSGTAQKLILNMISTGIMLRAGRIYGNLMVDMQAGNTKLRDRARRIVAEAAGLTLDAAAEQLAHANGEIKTAVAAALLKSDPETARRALKAAGGDLGKLSFE